MVIAMAVNKETRLVALLTDALDHLWDTPGERSDIEAEAEALAALLAARPVPRRDREGDPMNETLATLPPEWIDLAADIRSVDGNHDLGAGALAEALTRRGWTRRGVRVGDEGLREALDALPRLWWCGGWQTLSEKRYHGAGSPCHLPSPATCGEIAYVRAADLARALAATPTPPESDWKAEYHRLLTWIIAQGLMPPGEWPVAEALRR